MDAFDNPSPPGERDSVLECGTAVVYDPHTGNPVASAAQGAFPLMVAHLLPAGLRGIVVAGLLSALMGSLGGVFNAGSTLFRVDLYKTLRSKAWQRELVQMGRMATAIMVLISMMWIPVIRGRQGLYEYLQAVQAYLGPPMFVVFFFGIFWRRLNACGCLWAMITGFGLGLFRMFVDTPVNMGIIKSYPEGSFLWIINNINFQYFTIFISGVSGAAMILASYATAAPDPARIQSLTFGTLTPEDRARTRGSWGRGEVLVSLFVLARIAGMYFYFTG